MTEKKIERLCGWAYEGFWGLLTKWFMVPKDPPDLPTKKEEELISFRPSFGYLKYVKLGFWIGLIIVNLAICALWFILLFNRPLVAVVLLPVAFIVLIVYDILGFLAIHLKYDTTWYVLSGRSIRLRRGIWDIREQTITFENIQNIKLSQGPLQRFFGISDVVIETAGGGGIVDPKQGQAGLSFHHGIIEGVDNATEIRDMIMSKVRASSSAGLGDEHRQENNKRASGWTEEHIKVLREIKELM